MARLGRLRSLKELKLALKKAGLKTSGLKSELQERLSAHLGLSSTSADAPAVAMPAGVGASELQMASAADAAIEKMRAGENRAVEHVAHVDEAADGVVQAKGQKRPASAGSGVGPLGLTPPWFSARSQQAAIANSPWP